MQLSRKKQILILILSAIVIVSGIAGFLTSPREKANNDGASVNSKVENIAINENAISKEKLSKNKYPEVNALIERYQEGLTSGNLSILKEVYNTSEAIHNEAITSISEIIESYSDTVCYTKPGLDAGSYFVFVYDRMKIHNISTPAPNLSMVYVKTNAEGQLYIYRGIKNASTGTYEYDETTYQYIQLLSEDEEIKNLMATVYQEREAACSRDEQLRDFIDGLSMPLTLSVDETVNETIAETDESETKK